MALADLIIDLKSRRLPSTEQVGGKARNLMLLSKYGLPVPPGFCLTCAAYEQHVDERIDSALHNAFKKLQKAKKSGRPRILAEMRHLITTLEIDTHLTKELLTYYTKLKAPLVAVRSSATAEDQAKISFAGQYETILGVSSFEGLPLAVKKCWASLWSERAYEYCQKNNIDHASLRMAVIIQQQVAADFAGVIFTQDPATGRQDRVLIEFIRGLGDRLVSGHAAPDRVTVAKRGGQISETSAAGHKLDYGIVQKLASQAVRIEKKFGSPQDIEWAVAGKKIFFLQTRPITTVRAASRTEDRQIYTNANTGEVLPDVITPMTLSLAVPVVKQIFNAFLGIIGADLGELPVFKCICGRVYFNLTTLIGIMRSMPGFRKFDITTVFGGEQGSMGNLGNLAVADEDIPVVRFSISRACLFLPIRALQLMTYNLASGIKNVEKSRTDVERLDRIDLFALSDARLIKLRSAILEMILSSIRRSAFLAVAMMYYTNLDKLCQKWFKGKPGEHANRLLAGIGDIEPAKAGLALYGLSRICLQYPAVLRNISGCKKWQALRSRIARVKGGHEFLQAWQDFMVRYGHHARSEMELMYPRWYESPDFILEMVRNYLKADKSDGNPIEHYDRVIERRVKLTDELRSKIRNPAKRIIFDFYLKRAQQGAVLRENMKNMWVRAWFVIRRVTLEIGTRLRQRRIIPSIDDVFFLSSEEAKQQLKGAAHADVRALVKIRRREDERDRSITPPKVIRGVFDPLRYKSVPVVRGQRIMTGLAVSPGVVRGKARVIVDTRSKETVRPGEILIAPFTDPGWTPYFMAAAAIVVDMGGLFSHGSIVAREYGIPAVVNVGPATRIIKTGQTLEVDGDQGIVRIF